MTVKPMVIRYRVGIFGRMRVTNGIRQIMTTPPGERIRPARVAV